MYFILTYLEHVRLYLGDARSDSELSSLGRKWLKTLAVVAVNHTLLLVLSLAITEHGSINTKGCQCSVSIQIDEKAHILTIDGIGVKRPVKLHVKDLKENYRPVSVTSVVQCAGNRRAEMHE